MLMLTEPLFERHRKNKQRRKKCNIKTYLVQSSSTMYNLIAVLFLYLLNCLHLQELNIKKNIFFKYSCF